VVDRAGDVDLSTVLLRLVGSHEAEGAVGDREGAVDGHVIHTNILSHSCATTIGQSKVNKNEHLGRLRSTFDVPLALEVRLPGLDRLHIMTVDHFPEFL
jgi:hypothetical protein